MKSVLISSIIIFSIGIGIVLFLGCYLPLRFWNNTAVLGYCDVKGIVSQGYCSYGGMYISLPML